MATTGVSLDGLDQGTIRVSPHVDRERSHVDGDDVGGLLAGEEIAALAPRAELAADREIVMDLAARFTERSGIDVVLGYLVDDFDAADRTRASCRGSPEPQVDHRVPVPEPATENTAHN
jgi:hypothetical protein